MSDCKLTRPAVSSDFRRYAQHRIAHFKEIIERDDAFLKLRQSIYDATPWYRKWCLTNPSNGRWDSEYFETYWSLGASSQHLKYWEEMILKLNYSEAMGMEWFDVEDTSGFWKWVSK